MQFWDENGKEYQLFAHFKGRLGYITIWDLNKCPVVNTEQRQEPVEQKCTPHDRWSAAESAVRSLAFAVDGSYLVSAGDDKEIVVWPLT
jgi:WD40 repeat protein